MLTSRFRPQQVHYMKQFAAKVLVAVFGLALATAPLAANAAQWGVGIGVGGGGGVAIRAGYHNGWHGGPPPNAGWHGGYGYGHPVYGYGHPVYGYGRPVYYGHPNYGGPVFAEGYYGLAPAGFYGYYSHGRWFAHRRWNGGVWLYF
jgi:hypothetical protein